MAITKSAKENIRKDARRKSHNLFYKENLKKLLKEAKILISQKKIEEIKNILPKVFKILDKAAKVGVIKKNTASRKKSRIAKAVAKSSK